MNAPSACEGLTEKASPALREICEKIDAFARHFAEPDALLAIFRDACPDGPADYDWFAMPLDVTAEERASMKKALRAGWDAIVVAAERTGALLDAERRKVQREFPPSFLFLLAAARARVAEMRGVVSEAAKRDGIWRLASLFCYENNVKGLPMDNIARELGVTDTHDASVIGPAVVSLQGLVTGMTENARFADGAFFARLDAMNAAANAVSSGMRSLTKADAAFVVLVDGETTAEIKFRKCAAAVMFGNGTIRDAAKRLGDEKAVDAIRPWANLRSVMRKGTEAAIENAFAPATRDPWDGMPPFFNKTMDFYARHFENANGVTPEDVACAVLSDLRLAASEACAMARERAGKAEAAFEAAVEEIEASLAETPQDAPSI